MAIANKVTRLFPAIDESAIQAHFDELNAQGYYLIAVDNLNGWYRFFWAKEI